MYWQIAPDERVLRTLDWMNDECEAKLKLDERGPGGSISYKAIMSPTAVSVKMYGRKTRRWRWPVPLLITEDWVLFATKKPFGRRARVHKYLRDGGAPRTARTTIEIVFATDDEVAVCTELLPGPRIRADVEVILAGPTR